MRYLLAIWLLVSAHLIAGENCPVITDQELAFEVAGDRFSGEGGGVAVTLIDSTINCQVVGTVKGTFQFLSITVRYSHANLANTEVARILLNCISSNSETDWISDTTLRVIQDSSQHAGLLNAETLSNCSSCDGGGIGGDFDCVDCNSACDTGLGYCTGPDSDECCNFYDENTCVDNCAGNQFPNSTTFDCVCDQFYQEPQCTVCTLEDSDCQNGGTANSNTCQCMCDGTGYTGQLCAQDVDECTVDNPCNADNTESCVNNNGSYQCICSTGFDGMNCDNNIDDCTQTSCANGATCNDGVDSFTCTCAPGYTDDTCTTDINECADDPCQNGGTCRDQVNGYACDCVDQYEGDDCEDDVDECVTLSPCRNEGRCQNTVGGYECDCVGRWTNPTCDYCQIDNCLTTNCSGARYECLVCENRYVPVSTDKSRCVVCTIGNCTSCSDDNVCVSCAHNLVTNGTICQPRPDTREFGALNLGAIFGIIIGLGVLIAIVVVSIVVITAISLRIRAKKPIQYGAKNPIEHKDPIVLQKISAI